MVACLTCARAQLAFMSTSLSMDVARNYARGGGVVFAIQQGMADRGAESRRTDANT